MTADWDIVYELRPRLFLHFCCYYYAGLDHDCGPGLIRKLLPYLEIPQLGSCLNSEFSFLTALFENYLN